MRSLPFRVPLPLPLLLFLAALAPAAAAQNCSQTSIGETPIDDLGPGHYHGFQGGLYPGGTNFPPQAHLAAGIVESHAVVPRNPQGLPDPTGRIVFVSIGMSNTRQHWQSFMPISNGDPQRNPAVTLVQGAQGGQSAEVISDPSAPYWDFVQDQVHAAGATNAQVQVIWLLEAHAQPHDPFPQHAVALRDDPVAILQIARNLFPNARLAYVASRIYAGYATTDLNPEPYAYESAFSVKWTIEGQIDGLPGLNFDPHEGPVRAPWLAWGVYPWADGLVPRSDGLTWECNDFANDGTHPSPQGATKVANMLHGFLRNDPTSAGWYLGGGEPTGVPYCFGDGSGAPCPCGNAGAPGHGCANSAWPAGSHLGGQGVPRVSADSVVLTADGLAPFATCLFFQAPTQTGGGGGVPFGDGLRCAGGGHLIRLAVVAPTNGQARYPHPGDPPISQVGHVPPGGALRFYQAWYRDPAPGFCTPETFNFSNGFRIEWLP